MLVSRQNYKKLIWFSMPPSFSYRSFYYLFNCAAGLWSVGDGPRPSHFVNLIDFLHMNHSMFFFSHNGSLKENFLHSPLMMDLLESYNHLCFKTYKGLSNIYYSWKLQILVQEVLEEVIKASSNAGNYSQIFVKINLS